jgi:hypothetical protein
MSALSLIHNLAAVTIQPCSIDSTDPNCAHVQGPVTTDSGQITQILQIAFGVIGVIAVIIIIIGGIQLMTSLGGNPEAAKKARNTVIYAAIGLVIALSAEFIVTFVLNRL